MITGRLGTWIGGWRAGLECTKRCGMATWVHVLGVVLQAHDTDLSDDVQERLS
jgi:hypothetical protein